MARLVATLTALLLFGLGSVNAADEQQNYTVGIVLYPDFEVLDVYGPLEMWAYLTNYQIVLIAEEAGPIMSAQGTSTVATHSFDNAPEIDILMIPGGQGSRRELNNPRMIEFIEQAHEQSTYTTSVCTGSALLAKAGVLNGHRATSNKRFFFLSEQQSKEVEWVDDARWVESGNVFTSSGVSAGTDMALGLVARTHGIEWARGLASSVEYIWHEQADDDPFAQYVNRLQDNGDGLISSLPVRDSVLDTAPQWLQLFFDETPNMANSEITVSPVGNRSRKIPLIGVHTMGSNDLMGGFAELLTPGDYVVEWKAEFGAEAQQRNGFYRFTVAAND